MNDEVKIELTWVQAFSCMNSFERVMKLLDDAWLLVIERENPTMQVIIHDVRKHLESIGRLTGLNNQKRLEMK